MKKLLIEIALACALALSLLSGVTAQAPEPTQEQLESVWGSEAKAREMTILFRREGVIGLDAVTLALFEENPAVGGRIALDILRRLGKLGPEDNIGDDPVTHRPWFVEVKKTVGRIPNRTPEQIQAILDLIASQEPQG